MRVLSFLKVLFSRPSFQPQARLVFVGLGNPGEEYIRTRHNIGFRVVDAFCSNFGKVVKGIKFEAECCADVENKILVIKPLTFMNRSGDSVSAVVENLQVPATSVLVVVDDFNIPLGSIRIRSRGSDGGHNGLKSISARIGTEYPRLRIGVGPLPKGEKVIDFVLGKFSESEEERLKTVFPKAVAAMNSFVTDSIDTVMSRYNS